MVKQAFRPLFLVGLFATLMLVPALAYAADVDSTGAGLCEVNASGDADFEFDQGSGSFASSWRFSEGRYVGSSDASNGVALYAAGSNTWWKDGDAYYGSNGTSVWGAKGLGVDVSVHQGPIDWLRVKNSGVTFAIIRCGYGSDYRGQDDSQFLANIRGCISNGIPFGVYLYSYATTTDMAQSEAAHTLRLLNEAGLSPLDLSYPVYYDLEEGGSRPKVSNEQLLTNTQTFCNAVSAAGYTPGVYANTNWWTNYLSDSAYDQWPRWVAQYNVRCTYGKSYDIWQADDDTFINGITVPVDVDFDFTGPIIHGDQWVYSGGSWWYRYEGGSYPSNGWALIDDKWYYFDGSGWMQTGWVYANGHWYYLSDLGAMVDGWQYINDAWYYLMPDDGSMYEGWLLDGGVDYYLDPARGGAMATQWASSNGCWYWMGSSGAMQTDWQYVNGSWYYMDPETGKMCVGICNLGSSAYHLSSSGAMTTGWALDEGLWYWSDGNGALATGWHLDGASWYLLDDDSYAMRSGWQRVDGRWYYLDASRGGVMATGWAQVNNVWYYLDSSGSMITGWVFYSGSWYWLSESGAMSTGWVLVGNTWYWFDQSGQMGASRWVGDYYLGPDGAMVADQWIDGYYVGPDGKWDPAAVNETE